MLHSTLKRKNIKLYTKELIDSARL